MNTFMKKSMHQRDNQSREISQIFPVNQMIKMGSGMEKKYINQKKPMKLKPMKQNKD